MYRKTYRRTTPLVSGRVPGVRTLTEAMLVRDGLAYVGSRYYGCVSDAETERSRYVARLRRDALRSVPRALAEIRALLSYAEARAAIVAAATECPWCGGVVREPGVEMGGRWLHSGCVDQAMGAIYGEPTMAEMGVGTVVDEAREAA